MRGFVIIYSEIRKTKFRPHPPLRLIAATQKLCWISFHINYTGPPLMSSLLSPGSFSTWSVLPSWEKWLSFSAWNILCVWFQLLPSHILKIFWTLPSSLMLLVLDWKQFSLTHGLLPHSILIDHIPQYNIIMPRRSNQSYSITWLNTFVFQLWWLAKSSNTRDIPSLFGGSTIFWRRREWASQLRK